MKRTSTRMWSKLHVLLASFAILTLLSSVYLFYQNNRYQHENRRLIIINDSIMSVNIELQTSLQQKQAQQTTLAGSVNQSKNQ